MCDRNASACDQAAAGPPVAKATWRVGIAKGIEGREIAVDKAPQRLRVVPSDHHDETNTCHERRRWRAGGRMYGDVFYVPPASDSLVEK